MSDFLSGFISIVGSPNVGKSTLLNCIVGQKISIVSNKAQTTRNKITGILTKPDYQIVFLDTPGITSPINRLGDYMLNVAYSSMSEVEAILLIIDGVKGIKEKDEALISRLKSAKAPVVAVINKKDAAENTEAIRLRLEKEQFIKKIFIVSALNGDGVNELVGGLKSYLVPGPMYYPDDMVTDQPERVICGEIIREKALTYLREEIPHGLGVSVDKMELRPDGALYDIWVTIYCERKGHKGILLGKNGTMIKNIGQDARIDIERLLGVRANVQLWVKIKEDWRNSPTALKDLGYNPKS